MRIVAAAFATLALVGCGDSSGLHDAGGPPTRPSGERSIERFGAEAEGSERQALIAAFRGYLGALGSKHYSRSCALLAARVKRSLAGLVKGENCATNLSALLSVSAPALARRQAAGALTKVRASGDRAFVVFRAPGAELYQLTLVREGMEWTVSNLAASVLVPHITTAGK